MRVSPRLQLSWHNRRGSTCRGINEQLDSKDAARAISRESEELKELLEKELRRLENNETFAVNDFQKGAVRALIDLFRMVNGLANVLIQQASSNGAEPPARDNAA